MGPEVIPACCRAMWAAIRARFAARTTYLVYTDAYPCYTLLLIGPIPAVSDASPWPGKCSLVAAQSPPALSHLISTALRASRTTPGLAGFRSRTVAISYRATHRMGAFR